MDGIVFDKDFTNAYRDKYNEPCDCEQCKLFSSEFPKKYSLLIEFLSEFGVDPFFPLEIMDLGIKDDLLQREYMAYYAVKGYLPVPKMTTTIADVSVTMRNDDIANESYANTDMQAPFFVIELSDIFLNDNKAVFTESVNTGREIEFSYNGQHFFESRNSYSDWYIYCEETKETQSFSSAQELIKNTILQGNNINNLWKQISLDCIL